MSSSLRALALSSLLMAIPALAEAPESAQQARAPASEADGGEQPKLRCRKFLETGSLVKKRKVCMTAKQWAEVNNNAQERGREMQTLISTERGN